MKRYQTILRRLGRFQRDSRGTSAIEFALIAPVLVVIVVSIDDVSRVALGSAHMQSAVRAGIHYAMVGGTDETVARDQAVAAWTKKPTDWAVTTTKACQCAGVGVDCTTTPFCPDQLRPEMYMTVTATGTFGGNVYSLAQESEET